MEYMRQLLQEKQDKEEERAQASVPNFLPFTLHPLPSTLSPLPPTLNLQPSTSNPQPSTLYPLRNNLHGYMGLSY